MDRRNNQIYTQKVYKMIKRIVITIACCIPMLLLFGYFTRNAIKSNALMIFLYMLIMAVVVFSVEYIARRREKKRTASELLNDKKDVFK